MTPPKRIVSSHKNNDPAQSERFKQAARELGCDESEERFDEALRAVAKHKPKPDQPSQASESDFPSIPDKE